jgi:transcriptional regulator with XRE-family HTH domain
MTPRTQLRSYRERNNLTTRDLADMCGLSHTTIARYLAGEDISLASIRAISIVRQFRISMRSMLEEVK